MTARPESPGRPGRPDWDAVRVLVAKMLEAMGHDIRREGLAGTPDRVARAMEEMQSGYDVRPETLLSGAFTESAQYDGIVLWKGVPVRSLCEHHLLPWEGSATVAVLPGPGGMVIGISKVVRLVDCHARRLQLQERLTREVAQDLMDARMGPRGSAVIVTATHGCMSCRGVREPGVSVTTSAMLGAFRDDPALRSELLNLIDFGPEG